MDIEKRLDLIKRNTVEVVEEKDLRSLLEVGVPLNHYIGFEISGKLHLGALLAMMKIRDFIKAGVKPSIFLADWHAWINKKLGGDMEKIKGVGVPYMEYAFKALLKSVGADPEKVKFVLGSELYHNNDEYWETVLEISKSVTLKRMLRAITIAGRKENESISFAILVYPAMQVADVFVQGINIMHAGLDQRKAHMIAREVAFNISKKLEFNGKAYKPVAVHHELLLGLTEPPVKAGTVDKEALSEFKMSKSIPGSAIFITDSREDVEQKIRKAYCPAKVVEFNPILQWTRLLVFGNSEVLEVKRPEKFGGDIIYESYEDLEKDYVQGSLHPLDLKKALANAINEKLEVVRKEFETPKGKKLKEAMEELSITR